jgi:ABC-type amino acid transport substrate-binding protein
MKHILLTLFICLLSFPASAKEKESTYDRVMRTGKIRCGYNIEPPMLEMDPNTGKMSGATVDIVERIAKLMSLEIEWTEQVGWSEMTTGFLAGRYDLVCNGKWVFAPQARGGAFTPPLYYTAVHAYGRADETRFDDALSNMNSKDYTLTSMDGEINYYISYDMFPKTKKLEYPTMTSNAELIQSVINNKADATFMAAFLGNDYMAKNPGQIKQLTKDPIWVFDTALMYKIGESSFGDMLEAAIRQLHSSNYINQTLDKYNVSPDETLRVAKPYEVQ